MSKRAASDGFRVISFAVPAAMIRRFNSGPEQSLA